jgi:hypothetical protein
MPARRCIAVGFPPMMRLAKPLKGRANPAAHALLIAINAGSAETPSATVPGPFTPKSFEQLI